MSPSAWLLCCACWRASLRPRPFPLPSTHGEVSSSPSPSLSPRLILFKRSGSFERATEKAYRVAVATKDPVLAVVEGCRVCQSLQCDGSVGFGGSPDESGDTTLDAMIINGDTMQMGSVGFLSGVKDAIGVAYQVYKRTEMTLLAGAGASQFAKDMKFEVLPNLGKHAHSNQVLFLILHPLRNTCQHEDVRRLEGCELPAQLLGVGNSDARAHKELRPLRSGQRFSCGKEQVSSRKCALSEPRHDCDDCNCRVGTDCRRSEV